MLNNFFLNNFDQQAAALFLSGRTDLGVIIFVVISFFGNWEFVLPLLILILFVLFFKKQEKFIIPFVLVVGVAEGITFLMKLWFHRERPFSPVFDEISFAFPSGHATIAVVFYGYLAYILIKVLKNKYKKLIIILTTIIIVLIGLSRLYLGVHYVSDVAVGYLVGLLSLVFGIILSEKYLFKIKKK